MTECSIINGFVLIVSQAPSIYPVLYQKVGSGNTHPNYRGILRAKNHILRPNKVKIITYFN
jgi:hypothetical protein